MNTPKPRFQTGAEVRAWFRANGIVINDWCREHKQSRDIVASLLSGRLKGHRGKTHQAAVALGLKVDPALLPKKRGRK